MEILCRYRLIMEEEDEEGDINLWNNLTSYIILFFLSMVLCYFPHFTLDILPLSV